VIFSKPAKVILHVACKPFGNVSINRDGVAKRIGSLVSSKAKARGLGSQNAISAKGVASDSDVKHRLREVFPSEDSIRSALNSHRNVHAGLRVVQLNDAIPSRPRGDMLWPELAERSVRHIRNVRPIPFKSPYVICRGTVDSPCQGSYIWNP